MKRNLIIFLILISNILPTAQAVGQDFVIDPTMINIGTRYRNQVIRLYHETGDNTVLVCGSFQFGVPQVPRIHKVNWNAQPISGWAQGSSGISNGSGVLLFSRASDGYWLGGGFTLVKMGLNGTFANPWPETNNGPFESFQATCSWTDEQDRVYSGGLFLHWDGTTLHRTGILRHHPDGSLDEAFPLVPVSRTVSQTADVRRFTEYDDDRLAITGLFDTIQGHFSPRIAMLFKNGLVDTSFISPFGTWGEAYPVLIDSQGRMLVSYPYSTRANPLDTAAAWRLMPDGSLDPNFTPVRLNQNPIPELGIGTIASMSNRSAILTPSGGYIIGGRFDYANGQPRTCLAEIDSTGEVLPVSFETNQLFLDIDLHPWFAIGATDSLTSVRDMLETPDGSILIGGRFSGFAGQVSLNLVKIKRDIGTGTWQVDAPQGASVYPNPGGAHVHVSTPTGKHAEHIAVHDLSGRLLHTQAVTGQQTLLQTQQWGVGVFIIRITYADGGVESLRAVIIGQ